jgi:hypothetical protein
MESLATSVTTEKESTGVATGVIVVLLASRGVVGRLVSPLTAHIWDFWAGVSFAHSLG